VAACNDSPLFCSHCGKVQPNTHADYFQVFDMPRKLNLELGALEKQFYMLSRKLHPDLNARASSQEQEWSLANSSLLNDAYRTLKDPITRTEYLLKLEGVQMTEADSASKRSDPSRVPADLLEEVFELNMQLEEMRANQKLGEDDPVLRNDLGAAKAKFEGQLAETDSQLAAQRLSWDAALESANDPQKQRAKDSMVALLDRRRYVLNLVRDVNQALELSSKDLV
jgi:molecular chaperone HscB